MILFAIPVTAFAGDIVRVFRDDATVVEYAVRALRLHCMALVFVPITMVTEMGFQSTGQRLLASISSSLRSGAIFIPTILIMSHYRGMAGIQEAQPLSFVLSFFICIFLCRVFLKKLEAKQPDNI